MATPSIARITTLGDCRFPSPLHHCVADDASVPAEIDWCNGQPPAVSMLFEPAGPRSKLFFDAAQTRAGIVTCGGLSPGLNQVIRSLFLQLHHGYGVREVIGFRSGYQGLDPARGGEPIRLTAELVENIHKEGGTMLNTSRGPVDSAA